MYLSAADDYERLSDAPPMSSIRRRAMSSSAREVLAEARFTDRRREDDLRWRYWRAAVTIFRDAW
jgi:hypothetical protein